MMSAGLWWGIAAAVVGAAAVGGIAYAAGSQASQSSPQQVTGAIQFQAGHTYALAFDGAISPDASIHSAPAMQAAVDGQFGAGNMKVVLACVTDTTHATIVLAALKSFSDAGAFAGEVQASGGTATVTDITGKPLPSFGTCLAATGGAS